MLALVNFFRNFMDNEEGQALSEYALIIALVVVVAIVVLVALGGGIQATLQGIVDAL